ncbi:MAG: zinc ABC transporter substrate-binding protein [Ignavibacteriales bacterium]|nr:zinc ABC transporter substrate-binding protein [Ignavibacteriales bacterium]
MKKYLVLIVAIFLSLICSCDKIEKTADKIKIAVTILPFADFVENIGGDLVDVQVMIPPGIEPHTFEPTPQQLKELSDAKLYFRVGNILEFENHWLEKVKNNAKSAEMVDCSNNISIIDNNPHYWTGVEEVKIIIENIHKALTNKFPEHKQIFDKNKFKFLSKIDSVENIYGKDLLRLKGKILLDYHPAWIYLTSSYGIIEMSIEQEGSEPKPGELKTLIDIAKEKKIKAVFVAPQFDKSNAETIAHEINASLVEINPLPEKFLDNFEDVAKKIIINLE